MQKSFSLFKQAFNIERTADHLLFGPAAQGKKTVIGKGYDPILIRNDRIGAGFQKTSQHRDEKFIFLAVFFHFLLNP